MDVSGNNTENERNHIIASLQKLYKIFTTVLNKQIVKKKKTQEEKIKSIVASNETRISGINQIIFKLLDCLNTIEVYFVDK